MNRFEFRQAKAEDIPVYVDELFAILAGNMREIQPTGNTYEEDYKKGQKIALKIFKLLRMTQYGRVDMMYDDVNHEFWFIEANNLPGMTNTSLLPEAAKADGVAYDDLCESLVMNCGRY